jgi:hypothetical protein
MQLGATNMNIFILSGETTWAKHLDQQVQFMCDRHIVKMIAESTQMLVTALHSKQLFDTYMPAKIVDNLPCQPLSASMTKHPCTQWTMQSSINFNYLAVLALAMCYEHQHRYPLSPQHAYMPWLRDLVDYLHDECSMGLKAPMPTLFAIAVKDSTKRTIHATLSEAVDTYRDYYVRDKHKFATWKRRAKPMWFMMREEELISQGRL